MGHIREFVAPSFYEQIHNVSVISRRRLLKHTGTACLMASLGPFAEAIACNEGLVGATGREPSQRSINVVNFIRGVEPRGPVDLFLPVRRQMEILLQHRLPATWLLQYDALVSGPYVEFLKASPAKNHEIGIWFEMNEMHCKAANVRWRGRPGYEWDHNPSVAFTIGYSPGERIKLADAFMSEFKEVWGYFPKSVASWNLESITMQHLSHQYAVDAFAVCRDQIATDGFTIWGAPIAGYYPSKTNCWSPAIDHKNQIGTPVFRMLGQDPVYYYEKSYPLPDGTRRSSPDTMEPVWPSGRSPHFIKNFLEMIAESPALAFAYAQLGQENNFGWAEMEEAYPKQMQALAELADSKMAHVETMGETGRRFKRCFRETPPQAQVMLEDPFGNAAEERSIWYQSRFYRANLHLNGDLPYLRDITVYSDANPQPYLDTATTLQDVEQRMPAALDGYHWSATPGSEIPGAGGFFEVEGERLRFSGKSRLTEDGKSLLVELSLKQGGKLVITFAEKGLTVRLRSGKKGLLSLSFVWDPGRSAFHAVTGSQVEYRWQGFNYSIGVEDASATTTGWTASENNGVIDLRLAQSS